MRLSPNTGAAQTPFHYYSPLFRHAPTPTTPTIITTIFIISLARHYAIISSRILIAFHIMRRRHYLLLFGVRFCHHYWCDIHHDAIATRPLWRRDIFIINACSPPLLRPYFTATLLPLPYYQPLLSTPRHFIISRLSPSLFHVVLAWRRRRHARYWWWRELDEWRLCVYERLRRDMRDAMRKDAPYAMFEEYEIHALLFIMPIQPHILVFASLVMPPTPPSPLAHAILLMLCYRHGDVSIRFVVYCFRFFHITFVCRFFIPLYHIISSSIHIIIIIIQCPHYRSFHYYLSLLLFSIFIINNNTIIIFFLPVIITDAHY